MNNKIVYYEDIPVGEQGETCGRTFTEGDLVQFASVASDFCAPHMDKSMMSKTGYGERIGHGFYLNSLATGPNIRVPIGSRDALTRTAELSSNRM